MSFNKTELEDKAKEVVEKIKELVKEGNVTRIRVRKDENVILNIPMTVGVVGTMIGAAAAPWALVIAAITTIGFDCAVEVEKKDGTITTVPEFPLPRPQFAVCRTPGGCYNEACQPKGGLCRVRQITRR
jgi:DNA polymerase II small subunit/DNA polymerase delta subunit B